MTFGRTVCACADCAAHCTQQPGPLALGDLERIAAFLGLDVAAAAGFFWASPGALVGDRRTGRVFRVGTITPRLAEGRCVFFTDAGRCQIHAAAPFGCSHFDAHMSEPDAQARAVWLVQQQLTDAYQQTRATLEVRP